MEVQCPFKLDLQSQYECGIKNVVWIVYDGAHGRSGVVIDMYPFEAHHMPHAMTFSPSVYSFKSKLSIYEIISSTDGSKRAIICSFQQS